MKESILLVAGAIPLACLCAGLACFFEVNASVSLQEQGHTHLISLRHSIDPLLQFAELRTQDTQFQVVP